MLELFADRDFPLEATVEDGVAFELRMRNFDGHELASSQVRGAVDRRHTGAHDKRFDAEMLELLACLELLRQHFANSSRTQKHTLTGNQNSFLLLRDA
jgi:hypothetical protein